MNAPTANSESPAAALAPLKALVVDDTATNRQILSVFLKKLGFEVDIAEDGAKAVTRFTIGHPDLVLMDVMMPVMDGYEATRRIKAMCGDRWVPVVFLSALDKEESLVAGLDAGGDDYLSKPINFVVLDAKLRSLQRSIRLQQSLDEHRRRTRAISDSVLDAIVTIDEQGIVQSINAATTTLFGYTEDELVGQNVKMLMPEPYSSTHDGYLEAYRNGGTARIIGIGQRAVEGRRKDGSSIPLDLGVNEMAFEGRRLFVGVLRDVTEQRAAQQKLNEYLGYLKAYHEQREEENVLARGIIDRQMHRAGLDDPQVAHWFVSADNFSGDIIAAGRSADNRLYAMIADATGHGLSASISVVPVLTVFYGLVEQGYPIGYIAHEINRHLMATLPPGRFVAASMICINDAAGTVDIWVGGMPELLHVDAAGTIKARYPSRHLALGIADFGDEMDTVHREALAPGDQLVLFSDGLVEAESPDRQPFGLDRLEAALAGKPGNERLAAIRAAAERHLGNGKSHDDVSLLLVSRA